MFSWVLWIFLIIFAILYIYWRINYEKIKHIPGPKPIPIIGNGLDFTKLRDIHETLCNYSKTYGGVVRIMTGPLSMILVSDPKLLKFFLCNTEYIEKGYVYKFLSPWLGNGSLVSSGETWKTRRKLINAALTTRAINEFIVVFNNKAKKLVEKIGADIDKLFDPRDHIKLCSLDTITETALGVNMNVQDNMNTDYINSVQFFLEIAMKRMFSIGLQIDCIFRYHPLYKVQQKALKILHGTMPLIDKKFEESTDNTTESIKKRCLLDFCFEYCKQHKGITKEEVKNEADTMLFAGHSTVGGAMGFILYELSRNSDIQAKLFQEISEVTQNSDNVTLDELNQMKYMEMVIKESLRMYPPAPMTMRVNHKELTWGGYKFPKNCYFLIYAYSVHMDPNNYPNPEVFDPERFDSSLETDSSTELKYLPFSAGPRNCVGQKYAMVNMKVMLFHILINYKLLPNPNAKPLKLSLEDLFSSVDGLPLIFKRR